MRQKGIKSSDYCPIDGTVAVSVSKLSVQWDTKYTAPAETTITTTQQAASMVVGGEYKYM